MPTDEITRRRLVRDVEDAVTQTIADAGQNGTIAVAVLALFTIALIERGVTFEYRDEQ